MLSDMINEIIDARNKEERERAFKNLEKVGVDRRTACVMAAAVKKERKEKA